MATTTFNAEERTETGKGPARRQRAAGRTPAVIYGHGIEPIPITVDSLKAERFARHCNALLRVEVSGSTYLTLLKSVQRHSVRNHVEHMDLLLVSSGEKIRVDVPLVIEGEPGPGALVGQDLSSITVESEATHVPEKIVVDVTGKEVGQHVSAGELVLPEGTSLVTNPETLVVNISAPQAKDLGGASVEAGEAAGESTTEE